MPQSSHATRSSSQHPSKPSGTCKPTSLPGLLGSQKSTRQALMDRLRWERSSIGKRAAYTSVQPLDMVENSTSSYKHISVALSPHVIIQVDHFILLGHMLPCLHLHQATH